MNRLQAGQDVKKIIEPRAGARLGAQDSLNKVQRGLKAATHKNSLRVGASSTQGNGISGMILVRLTLGMRWIPQRNHIGQDAHEPPPSGTGCQEIHLYPGLEPGNSDRMSSIKPCPQNPRKRKY